ncbi:MAG: pitrilysin family protein [Pseudomonadota bacterium]
MYRKTILKNGVRIVSEKLAHFQSVSLGIWVDVGSRCEMSNENGISHFIEHMIFKGTLNRTNFQIAKELDAIGGFSNAFTGKENTCFHSKVLAKHFPTLADILSDIILNSIFDPQDMERERQVILQEIGMVEDTPDDYIHDLFNHLFWIGHPLSMPVLGTGETVSAIKKETILNYIRKFYTPERIVIAAAGNIDHEALVDYFRPLFESLAPGKDNHLRTTPAVNHGLLCHYKELEQVHLCLGGKGPHLLSDIRFAGAILNTILGGNMSSRLFQEIREKRGLAYSIFSFQSAYMDTGLLAVSVACSPLEVNNVIQLIAHEIKRIQRGEISRSDLSDALEHLAGGILLGAENTDTRMMRLAKNEYVFGRYLSYEELLGYLEKVTVDEVIAVAEEAFQKDMISMAALGPLREEDLDLSHLQFH